MFHAGVKSARLEGGEPRTVIDTQRSAAEKERRVIENAMEPVLHKHKLVLAMVLATKNDRFAEQLPVKEVNRYGLFNALGRITKDKGSLVNDERIDAVGLGMHDWTKQMVRDFKREEGRCRQDVVDKDVGQFIGRVRHAPEVDTDREAQAAALCRCASFSRKSPKFAR
jgi:hypothetical protein